MIRNLRGPAFAAAFCIALASCQTLPPTTARPPRRRRLGTGVTAGATPYLGGTGIEAQVRDGATNAIIAECEDTEVGRKYAADLNAGASAAATAWVSGYLNSFTQWSYAKDAFDKWAVLTARRLAALRAS